MHLTSSPAPTARPAPTPGPGLTALPTIEQRYWHKDHLGSTVASTNANLTVIERLAYEPFGKRRYPGGQFDPTGSIDAQGCCNVDWTGLDWTGAGHLVPRQN